jgi:hypothetical protein
MCGLCSRRALSGRERRECSQRYQQEGRHSRSVSRGCQRRSCKRGDAITYISRRRSIAGDTGLISYTFDEELGAIGFEKELAALDVGSMRCFVFKTRLFR